MRLNNNIRRRRQELGITKQSLADALGVSYQQFHSLEKNNVQFVRALDVDQLAEYLETTVEDLFYVTT